MRYGSFVRSGGEKVGSLELSSLIGGPLGPTGAISGLVLAMLGAPWLGLARLGMAQPQPGLARPGSIRLSPGPAPDAPRQKQAQGDHPRRTPKTIKNEDTSLFKFHFLGFRSGGEKVCKLGLSRAVWRLFRAVWRLSGAAWSSQGRLRLGLSMLGPPQRGLAQNGSAPARPGLELELLSGIIS